MLVFGYGELRVFAGPKILVGSARTGQNRMYKDAFYELSKTRVLKNYEFEFLEPGAFNFDPYAKGLKQGDIVFVPMYKATADHLVESPELIATRPELQFWFDIEIMSQNQMMYAADYIRKLVQLSRKLKPNNIKVLVHSEEIKKVIQSLGMDESFLLLSPHFELINLKKGLQKATQKAIRSELSLSEKDLNILFIGGYRGTELHDLLLELSQINKRRELKNTVRKIHLIYAPHPNYLRVLDGDSIANREVVKARQNLNQLLQIHLPGLEISNSILPADFSFKTIDLFPLIDAVIGGNSSLGYLAESLEVKNFLSPSEFKSTLIRMNSFEPKLSTQRLRMLDYNQIEDQWERLLIELIQENQASQALGRAQTLLKKWNCKLAFK